MAIVPIMTPAPAAPAAPTDLRTIAHEQSKPPERVMPVRGTSVRLSVPLDSTPIRPGISDAIPSAVSQTHKISGRHTLIRRDSIERREALLKGKEGSRQRRRWENGIFHHSTI
jgi:R3H-associated N-terminal domain